MRKNYNNYLKMNVSQAPGFDVVGGLLSSRVYYVVLNNVKFKNTVGFGCIQKVNTIGRIYYSIGRHSLLVDCSP